MLIKELVRTCSDRHVAHGAVRSLGGEFFARIENAATEHGVGVGEFVSETVRHFRRSASEADWMELVRATAGRDIPILCGLRHILEKSLADSVPGYVEPGVAIAPEAHSFMGFCCNAA